ncbi:MAG: hypothetical protein F4110_15555 [Acidimicrobiaceae bacterium]|nr:hypothetical protein [Acidimicrobiaceae bacterium]MYE98565.1 hypothetical protein [Acidimicrobiaceae bacterium]MYH43800.1 hypothetical protein [Acidimicrobiaceae bacterium]MYI55370.1 hypothetical protein [Acidimicrobiaceae bacterium]
MYLDKPMRDHVLLQAIARVNRPYPNPRGGQKRIGLVVDYVGVLRDLRTALQFDSSDVSGAIEDLDRLMDDFRERLAAATRDYLNVGPQSEARIPADTTTEHGPGHPGADEHPEQVVYTRFFDPEKRKEFFASFKDLEDLWEILSPSAELRDHIDIFKRLTLLYTAVRSAYSDRPVLVGDLAVKTRKLVQEEAASSGLGLRARTVTFDVRTVRALQDEAGPVEAKVFNLVRGLRQEVEDDSAMAPVLRPLRARAEAVLESMQKRTTAGLEAMTLLDALAGEKEAAVEAAQDSDLTPRAFAAYWALRNDEGLGPSGPRQAVQGADEHLRARLEGARRSPTRRTSAARRDPGTPASSVMRPRDVQTPARGRPASPWPPGGPASGRPSRR